MCLCFDNIFLVFNVTVTTTKILSQSTSILTQPITESHTTTPSTSTVSNKSMMSTIYVSGSRLTTYHTSERLNRGRHLLNRLNVDEPLALYPHYRCDMFNYLTHARATSAYSLKVMLLSVRTFSEHVLGINGVICVCIHYCNT